MTKKYLTEDEKMELKILTKIFMEYINEKEIPKQNNKIRFSNINDKLEIDANIYSWLVSQLYYNIDLFKKYCEEYKDIYPNAYKKISIKLSKRENFLNAKEKAKILMQYLNQEEIMIPTCKKEIRFCDIYTNTKNDTNVGTWIQDQLENGEEKFLRICSNYKEEFPIAYKKIILKLNKRNTNEVEKERQKIFMHALENGTFTEKTRFSDIDKHSVDQVMIESWFTHHMNENTDGLEKFLIDCSSYKEQFPKAFILLEQRIHNLIKKREQEPLTDIKRTELLLNWLNIPEHIINKTLTFSKIDNTCKDNSLVTSWINCSFSKNIETLFINCIRYKDVYPIGYNKMLKRMDTFIKYSEKRKNYISYEEKMKVLIYYFQIQSCTKISSNLTFSDIANVSDDSNISIWINANLSKDSNKFIAVLNTYKEQYPIGYTKLIAIINNSKACLQKQRKDLIRTLKEVKNTLLPEEKTHIKIKSLSQI